MFAKSKELENIIQNFTTTTHNNREAVELYTQEIILFCMKELGVYADNKYSEYKDSYKNVPSSLTNMLLGENCGSEDCITLLGELFNEIPEY